MSSRRRRARRRQGGGALRQHRGGLRSAAAVDAAGATSRAPARPSRSPSPSRDRGAGRARRVVERIGQCEVGGAPLLARVHVEQRRREQRVREPARSRTHDDDAGRAQLVEARAPSMPASNLPERRRARGRVARAVSREALEAACGARQRGSPGRRAPDRRPRRARARSTGSPPDSRASRSSWVGLSARPVRSKTRCARCAFSSPSSSIRSTSVPVPLGESRQLELEPDAHGRDEPDPRAVEPPECERQRPQARRVHPLQVVDGDHERGRAGQAAKHAEHAERDRRQGRRSPSPARPAERVLQRGALGFRQLPELVVVDALRAGRSGPRTRARTLPRTAARWRTSQPRPEASSIDRLPDRRLADPGLADEQQPARSARRPRRGSRSPRRSRVLDRQRRRSSSPHPRRAHHSMGGCRLGRTPLEEQTFRFPPSREVSARRTIRPCTQRPSCTTSTEPAAHPDGGDRRPRARARGDRRARSTARLPRLLEIEGEAGIGKTTLWEEAVRLARDAGALVLACRPAEVESPVAYGALACLLEPLLADRRGRRAGAAPARARGSAPPPRRAQLRASTRPPSRSGRSRRSARQPSDSHVVLAVDDVQWLDASSRIVLTYALRNLGAGRSRRPCRATRTRWQASARSLSPAASSRDRGRPPSCGRSASELSTGSSTGCSERRSRGRGSFASTRSAAAIRSTRSSSPGSSAVADANGIALEVPDSLADVVRARLAPLSRRGEEAARRRRGGGRRAAGAARCDWRRESALDEAIDHGILRARPTVACGSPTRCSARRSPPTRARSSGAASTGSSRISRRRPRSVPGTSRSQEAARTRASPPSSSAPPSRRAARGARGAGAALYEQAALSRRPTDAEARDARLLAAARAHFQAGEPDGARALLEPVAAGEPPGFAFEAHVPSRDAPRRDRRRRRVVPQRSGQRSAPTTPASAPRPIAASRSRSRTSVTSSTRCMHADAAVAAAEPLGDPVQARVRAWRCRRSFAGSPGTPRGGSRSRAGSTLEAAVELPSLDACPSAVDADLRRIGFELARRRVLRTKGCSDGRPSGATFRPRPGAATGSRRWRSSAGRWDRAHAHAEELSATSPSRRHSYGCRRCGRAPTSQLLAR